MLGAVAEILKHRASEGWLVGGSVRDRMLGRYSPDLDVVVADDASVVARQVASSLHAPWFALSDRYPTYRVLGSDGHVDVAAIRGGSILADLAQRDFTVNAMAVPIQSVAASGTGRGRPAGLPGVDLLLDPFGGAAHLSEGRLVAVSGSIFTDDPLRLMRAPRFCHTLGLQMDESLARMVREQARDLGTAAAERVVNEMCLTLASGRSAAATQLWDDLGLLTAVLPELASTGGAPDERRAVTLSALARLDELLDRPADWFSDAAVFLKGRMDEPIDGVMERPVALRMAGLLSTLSVDEVRTVGRRLKLSGALVSLLTAASRCLGAGGWRGDTQGRAAVLFMWDAAPWEAEVVLLAAAHRDAGEADSDGTARRLMALAAARASGGLAKCPVDGQVLMRQLGLESGPALGRALREARLAWEAGEATTVEKLLAVAQAVLS
jgi:poly(A) polymerase